MNTTPKDIIKDVLRMQKHLLSLPEGKELFRDDVPPVVWFGDINSAKPKILVISANPNNIDKPEGNPRIPSSYNWDINKADVKKMEDDYNDYFRNNPDTGWFGKHPGSVKNKQGRIETFMNGLDASFYDGEYKYQGIHIDLLPFVTKLPFSKIADRIMAIPGLPEWIDQHLKEMIALIQPKLIVVNGRTNFEYFNQCVGLGLQPYHVTIHTFPMFKDSKNITVWETETIRNAGILIDILIKVLPVIATSVNMGSSCKYAWQVLYELGKRIKAQFKL